MSNEKIIPLHVDRPARADAVRNRRLLLDTALALIQANGIEQVTMSDIAKEAGVGKGTLYRHFTDKAQICHALLDEDMRDFQRQTLTMLRSDPDPLNSLRWFLEAAVKYVMDHSDLLQEAANESGLDMLRHPAHLWWRQTIAGLLARLQPLGDASYIADVLYILLDVQTIRFQRLTHRYDLPRIVAGLHMTLDRYLGIG
jgi:AcrR family transcriptional regulator